MALPKNMEMATTHTFARRKPKATAMKSLLALLREMFAYGLWAGADSLAETCTTRLN